MWIIMYGNHFWDGMKFTKDQSKAMKFKSKNSAWAYIDEIFDEDDEDFFIKLA